MFWPFLELDGELVYCPLADFGLNSVRTGQDIYAHAIVGQPVTAHTPLYNALAVSGTIAVVQRGMCNFVTKVWHAQQAGAVAVLVANNIGVGKGEAFVMDGGHCPNKMLAQVTIPAMMLSRALSLRIFAQIRHADLDHTDLYVTIRFLGAEIASQVLAQQEQHKQPRWHGEEIRERQQQEAATLLRNRLDTPKLTKAVGFSNNTSDTSNSIDNQLLEPSQEGNHQDQTATSTNLHWCPMATTAVLVLDVQNYFTLPHANNVKEDVLDVVSRKQFPRVSDPAYYACIDTKLIPTVQDVLFACRERKNMEIVYSVVESATCDGRERSQLHKHAGIYVPKRSDGAQMPTRIKPRDSDIVLPRTGVNVFTATNFDFLLQNLRVKHLVVVGISALQSVEACVRTALDRGYHVTVLKDALLSYKDSCRRESTNALMLEELAQQGAQILQAAEFVDKLQSFALK